MLYWDLRNSAGKRDEESMKFYKSAEWYELVRIKRYSVGNKCEVCESPYGLQVHHLNYDRFGGQELLEDLKVLCDYHHRKEHGIETYVKELRRRLQDVCFQLVKKAERK